MSPHPRPELTHVLKGDKFLLMFRFDDTYPISAPAVQFVVDDTHKAPVHPVRAFDRAISHIDKIEYLQHVYSNGHVSVCSTLSRMLLNSVG